MVAGTEIIEENRNDEKRAGNKIRSQKEIKDNS